MQEKTFVIVIVGPTASGKTSLAVSAAEKFSGEVVSADSMQIYKQMNIATAKPTKQEMRGVKHHMIDFLPVTERYSVADYVKDAKNCIDDIASRGKLPIIAGGTGLYIDSLIENVAFTLAPDDYEYREKLIKISEEKGGEFLLSELEKIDPATAQKLHYNNTKRIIRALEVYHITGKKMSEILEMSKAEPSCFDPLFIGINYRDREKLYNRINLRVDLMIEQGLISEAEKFINCEGKTAVQAIGYKELMPYFNKELALDVCVENLKRSTRNYAKRQITWFKRNDKINWFYPDDYSDSDVMINDIFSLIERKRFDE